MNTGVTRTRTPWRKSAYIRQGAIALLAAALLQGCIIVRATEQRVWLKKDGTGEGILRLIDIRSDESSPEALKADFQSMMNMYLQPGLEEFENADRKVTGKNLYLAGDTLIADIHYTFTRVSALDEIRFNNDEVFVVVPAGKIIVRHNGSVESYYGDTRRIVWDRNVPRLMYEIRERSMPNSTSLGSLYSSSLGK